MSLASFRAGVAARKAARLANEEAAATRQSQADVQLFKDIQEKNVGMRRSASAQSIEESPVNIEASFELMMPASSSALRYHSGCLASKTSGSIRRSCSFS